MNFRTLQDTQIFQEENKGIQAEKSSQSLNSYLPINRLVYTSKVPLTQ